MQQQVKHQDGTEHIEYDPAQAAGINIQGLAKQKPCSTDEQNRQKVIGEGGQECIELHIVVAYLPLKNALSKMRANLVMKD